MVAAVPADKEVITKEYRTGESRFFIVASFLFVQLNFNDTDLSYVFKKNKIKMKTLPLVALFIFLAASLQAQTTAVTEKQTKKEQQKEMLNQLNLSKEQKKQLKEIQKEQKDELYAIKNNKELSEKERKEKEKGVKEQYSKKREQVFTVEQKEKMKEYRKAHPLKNRNKKNV